MSSTAPTSTVTPDDSTSQAGTSSNTQNAPKPQQKKGPRRSPKQPKGKDAPSGAVPVPAGGQNVTGKKSQVVSETIPLSGWGETDLSSHRKDIRPEFTVDANPYVDLVDAVYDGIQSRYSSQGKHLPYAFFVYYCMLMWWYRVLYLHKTNANTLSQEEKQVYNVLTSGEEFMIPAPIAQYLANLGNFAQGGETFYFRKLDTDFSGIWEDGNVEKGWLKVGDGITISTADSFWKYAHVPVPGLLTLLIQAECGSNSPTPYDRPDLSHISPQLEGCTTVPTANIVGWKTRDHLAHHASWRSTYSSLGWGTNRVPIDMQTNYNISNSTLKWISEKLETVNGLKLHSSKQLSLSVQGNPIIAQYLTCGHETDAVSIFRDVEIDDHRGALNYDLTLASRFSMDDKYLAPSFTFGYRIHRQRVYSRTQRYYYSEYDPFLFWSDDTDSRRNLPQGWWESANATFEAGSQNFINIDRFTTHALNRSNGINAAVNLAPS